MTENSSSPGALLQGITVIDLTHHLAGPWCTMMLADFGAEVIKIEPVGEGDTVRTFPPYAQSGDSGPFMTINRNKKSVAVNLRAEEGRDLVRRLSAQASVFIQNFTPGVVERMGLSYDALSAINPGLVYCSISGFGLTGPRAKERGRDLVAQAMSGLMSVTGHAGGDPAKCGVPVTDLSTGMLAACGILAALVERSRSGRGQHLEASLFETGLGLLVWEIVEHFFTGRTPAPVGSGHRAAAPYQAYPASDGYFVVCAESPQKWPDFCAALGLERLMSDPHFDTLENRVQNVKALEDLVRVITVGKPMAHWIEIFSDRRIPVAPVNTVQTALNDPQVRARELVVEMDHPTAGIVRALGPLVRFGRTPAGVRYPAPALGQHTDDILARVGVGAEELSRLREAGTVQ